MATASASPPAAPDSGQVIRCVSESLRRLICHHISELQAEASVVFESPADIDNQGDTKLSLYLSQAPYNPYLRNLPPTVTRQAGASGAPAALALVPAPLVVDLVYLLVPYAKSTEIELVLMDKLMRLFHDIRSLSGKWLDPLLRLTGNSSIDIVPDDSSIETLRSHWAGFYGKSYKLSRLYTLSPVRIPSALAETADMTTDATLTMEAGH